jgi:tRNA A-37 threonylcarbamoyl transferase component Bud32
MEVARSRPGKLAPGSQLGDTYQIVRLVGEGGMGEVYEVRHARLAGRYALKIIRKEMIGASETAVRRFQREAEVTSSLQHPNIVHIIDFNRAPDGSPYFVMEFLEGMDLEARMRQRGVMPPAEALPIIEQIASALAAAHGHGVVHRDLKPQNVLLVPIPVTLPGQPTEFVKVVDFGISKVKSAESLTGVPVIMGTPHYMAPEQARGSGEDIDGRTDQFALAAMTYELVSGRKAFPGDNMTAIIYNVVHEAPAGLTPVVGEAVDAVLRAALQKDRNLRYPSMTAFVMALRQAISRMGAGRTVMGGYSGGVPRTYESEGGGPAPALPATGAPAPGSVAAPPSASAHGSAVPPPGRLPPTRRLETGESAGIPAGAGPRTQRRPSESGPAAAQAGARGGTGRRRGPALVLSLVAVAALVGAAGMFAWKRLSDDRGAASEAKLADAGRSIREAAQQALGAERRALSRAVREGAAVPELHNAVSSRVDAFTFNDLLETEEWWQPYRDLGAVVFDGDRSVTTRGVSDVADSGAWKFWRQAAGGPAAAAGPSGVGEVAEAVLLGTERAYLAAGAAFAVAKQAPLRFGLVLAKPLDAKLLGRVAEQAGARAVLVSNGKRMLASSVAPGADAPRGIETLAGQESLPAVGLSGGVTAAAIPLRPDLWLWMVREGTPGGR